MKMTGKYKIAIKGTHAEWPKWNYRPRRLGTQSESFTDDQSLSETVHSFGLGVTLLLFTLKTKNSSSFLN